MRNQPNKFFPLLLFLLLFAAAFSQQKSDSELLLAQSFTQQQFEEKRKVAFMFSRKRNPLIRYNPVSLSFGVLLFSYQKFLSPQVSAKCPYNPSCSGFSKSCIQRFGLLKGIALSADRLTRCNAIAAKDLSVLDFKEGKIDDLPEKYRVRAEKKK